MKPILILILILIFTSSLVCAGVKPAYFPLEEGNYWVYQDQIEIQDPQGDFEIYSKSHGENVKVKRINQLRTLKVLSTEIRGDFKIAKMQEETLNGARIFFYVVNNEDGKVYSCEEEQIEIFLPNEKDVSIEKCPEYIFPLQAGLKWGDSDDLKRKDNMYIYYVERMEDITVPAGTFKNCFKIVYSTLPDKTIEWFCPNIGVVRLEYHHHGTINNLVSELKEVNLKRK